MCFFLWDCVNSVRFLPSLDAKMTLMMGKNGQHSDRRIFLLSYLTSLLSKLNCGSTLCSLSLVFDTTHHIVCLKSSRVGFNVFKSCTSINTNAYFT